ncbi:MAG: secondary thiamine-phosphate synthase enzyme YjbQ [Calditrichia bacterium]|nr:secondary thiamine-phosphate synthase enzyme YjbQ [Calditrichia bacterium]
MYEIEISTTDQVQFIDITQKIKEALDEEEIKNGICIVFVPHTTAAVTINENADPDVSTDMIKEINKIVPFSDNYRHFEGNSAAHLKSSMVGVSETVIIEEGNLKLGRWQGIYFCEFDGPRKRKIWIKPI